MEPTPRWSSSFPNCRSSPRPCSESDC
jgi:hypothetical protein